jgi:hypothetical protein
VIEFSTLLQFLALLATALFAGAALYINLVEHPARLSCGTASAWKQWVPSYRRATWMQAPLAIAGGLAGLGVGMLGGGATWSIAAVLILSVVPYTFVVIMPTNHRLLAPDIVPDAPPTRALLLRWGRLHAGRTALSLGALGLFLAALFDS